MRHHHHHLLLHSKVGEHIVSYQEKKREDNGNAIQSGPVLLDSKQSARSAELRDYIPLSGGGIHLWNWSIESPVWMLIACVCFSHVKKRSLSRVSNSFFFGSFGTPLGLSLLGLVGFFSSPNSSLAFASLLLLILFLKKNNNSINKNNQFLR